MLKWVNLPPMPSVRQYDNAKEFQARAMPFWSQNECENCTAIGIVGRLVEGKSPVKGGAPTVPLLLAIEDDDQVVATALQTPPHALVVSRISDRHAGTLVARLRALNWSGDLTGVLPDLVRVSAALGPYSQKRGLRVFRITRVIEPPRASGRMRAANDGDLQLVQQWAAAFSAEIGEPDPNSAQTARSFIGERRLFIWDDPMPVSMAAWAGPTPNGVRINFVYTPHEFRGRGYASNLVAQLTQDRLDSGRKFCFLFTDRDNPTSNSIYQKLGYEPVADFAHLVRSAP